MLKLKQKTWFVAMMVLLMISFSLVASELLAKEKGRGSGPVVYVTGQSLFYDSIVVNDALPPHGPFQKLEMTGPSGLQTMYGPGDHGYVGGRWRVDANGNNEMDSEDAYFSCPLLGPGREEQ